MSDDDSAAAKIGAFAEKLGFSPINPGALSEGRLLAVVAHSTPNGRGTVHVTSKLC